MSELQTDPFHDVQLDIGRFVMCCTSLEWLAYGAICSLLQDRRAILHNPLLFDLWENDQGDHAITAGIHLFRRRRPAAKPLTTGFIRESADKAEGYALEAHRLWSVCFPGASLFEH